MGLIYRSVETMSHHISKSTQLVILSIWHCFGFLEDNFWKIVLSKIEYIIPLWSVSFIGKTKFLKLFELSFECTSKSEISSLNGKRRNLIRRPPAKSLPSAGKPSSELPMQWTLRVLRAL